MIRRHLAVGVATSVTAALLLPLGAAASAADPDSRTDLKQETASLTYSGDKGVVLDLGQAKGSQLYIVQLDKPAIPTRDLVKSKDSTQRTESESSYAQTLASDQATLRRSIAKITGAAAKVRFSYTHAVNGMAVELTRAQALEVSRLPGIKAVQVDFTRELDTDRGPAWIGATGIWDGSDVPNATGTKGEGVVVGIIDTGINPANPSFADVVPVAEGGDGYDHTNPRGAGDYVGACDPANTAQYVPNWGCNDKLIGYWDFDVANNDDGDFDDDGHGSHTGSTTAGNQVKATTYSAKGTVHEFSATRTISGVAPHANVIGYDVCDGAGCQGSSIIAAIEQTIIDEVDVINYSIGSSSAGSPWTDADALAFLNARAAGVNVATSAGNDGPGFATLGSPADSPWLTSVGASTHDRQWQGKVQAITDGSATLPDISGVGFSGPAASSPVVYAGAAPYNNGKCVAGGFAPGTDFTGKIVICDRGTNGRVEKGAIVAGLGASGMILANDQASGTSINADAHEVPAVHITYADGVTLKEFVAAHPGTSASLSGGIEHIGDDVADIMAAFSSRGPNRATSIISPSVSAPGVDILAAAGTDNSVEWHFISGTSMASPHTAGALALLTGAQPAWTPAERQSALMMTAKTAITDSDGTAADWFDMGSGRIDLTKAAKAGLVLDETKADYLAADPAKGGDVRTLNLASMADNECLADCGWTRTFTGTPTGVGTWTAAVTSDSPDLSLAVDKSSFAVTDGGDVDLTVTATLADGASTDEWMFGTLELTPPTGSTAPAAHLPIAVKPSAGVLPKSIDITTRRDAGSDLVRGLQTNAASDLQLTASGLVPEQRKQISVVPDTTNSDPWDGNGVHVEHITVPAGADRLVAKLEKSTALDNDMYVGVGEVSEANVVCMSATAAANESCDIAAPEAGDWWILVQNWEGSDAPAADTADLVTALVVGSEGNLRAEGPASVAKKTPYDVRVFWDEAAMEAGQVWYGALTMGTDASHPDNIGVMPVQVRRVADDVTKTADVDTATPGDVITYTVEVQPNTLSEDHDTTVVDTLPANTTYVDGSATNGATYADGKITWTKTMPTSYGKTGSYELTTSAQDATCVNPFEDAAAYTNLADYGVTPQSGITGDTKVWTAFGTTTFGHYDQQYAGLSFTDDGFLVSDPAANYAGEPWVQQALPNQAAPNNVAAPLWQDMEITYDAATNKGVSIAAAGSLKVIEFDDVHVWGDPSKSYDMEVFKFDESNDYTFVYDNITGPLDAVTIGMENADGTNGQALVNNGDASSVITNGTVVCATYNSPVGPVETFTYQVTVDDTAHNREVLVNNATSTTTTPGSEAVTVSDSVTVEGALERSSTILSVNPDQFAPGETTTATATVFSAGEAAPTGEVQFLVGDRVAGTATVGENGKAIATLSGFSTEGVFPVTAKYSGDANTLPSTSDPVNVMVGRQPKVTSKIEVQAPKKIRKGKRAKVVITVLAPRVTPSGTVKVTVRGAVKTRTYTLTLNQYGKATLRLAKARKVGKIRGVVRYLGDAAVTGSSKT
ncbi:MAG: S8 family serine peptidase, partial [Nocardioides sp.]|nr:S8 family serine peptidase [Nocardioides sp.]